MAKLFEELKRRQAELTQFNAQSAQRGIIRFPPEEHAEGSRRIFQNLSIGGFSTFILPGKEGWDPMSPYFNEARVAAKKPNISFTRLIIIPHLHYMRDRTLYQHWKLDVEAGINVQFLILGKEILDLLHLLSLTEGTIDFGLWDDNTVSWYVGPNNFSEEAPQWIISAREADIENGRKIRDLLLSQSLLSITPEQAQAEFALTEPLLKTAPMADMLADFLCEGSHIDQESCRWYHKAWQYLRILDLVSTPSWHPEFYLGHMIQGIDPKKHYQILISGTADYSTLAYVYEAFKKNTRVFNISVLDLCQTPLILCKWYAASHNFRINTFQRNILELDEGENFDYIVTDAFLTRFDDETKKSIVNKWYRLLNPGGKVVTTIRIVDYKIKKPIKATNEERDNFAETAYNLAVIWKDFVQKEPDYIKEIAWNYADNMGSSPLDFPTAISIFVNAGFSVELSEKNNVKGEMKSTTYLEIIAKKS